MIDKTVADAATAVAGIPDGATVMIGGFGRAGQPVELIDALIALGHHEELAMHLRAALRNGLTVDEIKEVILQAGLYCGVPAANTAFRIAKDVFAEES